MLSIDIGVDFEFTLIYDVVVCIPIIMFVMLL